MAGFECSTPRMHPDRRLDLVASTRHDQLAMQDYQRLQKVGIRVAREGLRWHLIESQRGVYDFSTVDAIFRAATATRTQVIWDICHFGWPDHIDLLKPEFVSGLARMAHAFAQWLTQRDPGPHYFVPMNEISFFSWAAGEEGSFFPFLKGRGWEVKCQLVRGALAVMDAIREVQPESRFALIDPLIHVVADPRHPEEASLAEAYRLSQFQGWDMLSGRLCPELGGGEDYLDIIGLNYYPHNQWYYNLKGYERVREFTFLKPRHRFYRPLQELLREVSDRYGRPMFLAETGAEDEQRPRWLRYVTGQVEQAIARGLPLHGMCLYPILNHPGWANHRHCHNGLWDYADGRGHRPMCRALARELKSAQNHLEYPAGLALAGNGGGLTGPSAVASGTLLKAC